MKLNSLCSLALLGALGAACSTKTAEPAKTAAAESTAAAEASAEDEHAEALAQLNEEREKLKASHAEAVSRWSPELKSAATSVAEGDYSTGREAIEAAVAGSYRQPGNAERAPYRHPVETLEFLGFRPDMTVLEYGPGGGWYTELLAPALAAKGKLLITSSDPNGPAWERSTFYGERTKMFLEASPELYGKVELATFDTDSPKLDLDDQVDMILVIRGMHGMHNRGEVDTWLKEFNEALKPGGILGIVQHRAKAGANPDESSKQGYLPEAWVIEKVEAAGFSLAAKSEVNANPSDTTDHPKGVWTLPPSFAMGDQDREKYLAIGESDRMTLKFTKD